MSFIRCAVLGHPIAHSKSPIIHTHWIERYGFSGSYGAIDIPPDDLSSVLQALIADGYAGFNVTLPHKQAVLNHCYTITPAAQAIGAVNTLIVDGAGRLSGDNTDAFGFLENLRQMQPGFTLMGAHVLMLGAGGAARAAIFALLGAGVDHITLVNRTLSSAQKLADMAPTRISPHPWEAVVGVMGRVDLLVNTTSLGMMGKEPLVIDLTHLSEKAVVYDIVYAPLMTDLLRTAQARGNQIVTGIGMLLHQARPAFAAWFGTMPALDDDLLKKVLG